MINKFYLEKFCASSSDRAVACTFLPDDLRLVVVCMNDEMKPAIFETQGKNWFQNVFNIAPRIRCFSVLKEIDNITPERIPCDCSHLFSG
jgi:hypothetical protein